MLAKLLLSMNALVNDADKLEAMRIVPLSQYLQLSSIGDSWLNANYIVIWSY